MCGIVGLYLKNPDLRPKLGALFHPMLIEMTSRGPDSAGVAIYRDPVEAGSVKLSLAQDGDEYDWSALSSKLGAESGGKAKIISRKSHATLVFEGAEKVATDWLLKNAPEIRLVGSGEVVEIFKDIGLPEEVYARFDLKAASGSHMIGHTRMATESAVTTAGSHPFATGQDLCLVHNGSLSNHMRLRQGLEKEGICFQTENDSEVAAAYMTSKLREGASVQEALNQALEDLDGFYTFCIGTRDGFAVVRDPIACKHAVLAETEDWVAMATEYRAIATLPGAEKARVWEPKPQMIYVWGEAA